MLNPGFVSCKALAEWHDVPALLPQFRFHEKHCAVISYAMLDDGMGFRQVP